MGVEGNDLATIDFEIDGSKDKSNFPVSSLPVLKKILNKPHCCTTCQIADKDSATRLQLL
jgi:hypothetical protein